MKHTAVEWLLDNLITEPYSELDFKHNKECWDKAKEMEKEQIIQARTTAPIIPTIDMIDYVKEAEQYYNETFKSE